MKLLREELRQRGEGGGGREEKEKEGRREKGKEQGGESRVAKG